MGNIFSRPDGPFTKSGRHVVESGGMTPDEQKRGRRQYFYYTLANGANFSFFLGSVLIVYLLKFDASNTEIGIYASFMHAALPLAIFGAALGGWFGILRTFRVVWASRSIMVSSIILAPWAAQRFGNQAAIWLILAGMGAYTFFRALGTPAFPAIAKMLAPENSRAKFFALAWSGSLAVGFLVYTSLYFFLKPDSPFWMFQVVFATGVFFGLLSIVLHLRIPNRVDYHTPNVKEAFKNTLSLFRHTEMRLFVLMHFLLRVAFAMMWMFAILYVKRVIAAGDDQMMLNDSARLLGQVVVSLLLARFADRFDEAHAVWFLGGIAVLNAIGFVLLSLGGMSTLWFFLPVLFLIGGVSMMEGVWWNAHLLKVVPKDSVSMSMAILNMIGLGVAVFGSIFPGWVLDKIVLETEITETSPVPYLGFFGAACVLILAAVGVAAAFNKAHVQT